MGTRSAAFTAKIRNLQENCSRLQNSVFPIPSGLDLANILKYFSQVLLGVLKDVPSIPLEVICSPERDHARISMFPSLDYKGLYNAMVHLMDALPLVQTGIQPLGQALIHALACLVPFLEHQYMDTLPYLIANTFAVFPSTLHKDLLDMLCYNLLPFTINSDPKSDSDQANYANMSVPAVLMMVFNYCDNPSYQTQLLECLMRLKRDVVNDLFFVIAHGTAKARCPAVELLFQYWPDLNPSAPDRKMLSEKHASWQILACQHENCSSASSQEGIKMCVDHTIAINASERPPPIAICIECADIIYRGRNRETLEDVLLPMTDIPYTCENKACKSPLSQKIATATCFSNECANYNNNRPIRYCKQCNQIKHSGPQGAKHLVHTCPQSLFQTTPETQLYLIEAIITLLKEAASDKQGKEGERLSRIGLAALDQNPEATTVEERQLLSRYGVWLLVNLCDPREEIPKEILGRLLSALFQWFHYTACLPDDQAGSALERLKAESIHGWIMDIIKSQFDVFVSCLLPHPMDYAKVGGHWDTWPSQTHQIKEGFKRLLCLVPYDIITERVWSHIMPYWMECFRHEVPEDELSELKILLSKVLDPDLSPLGLAPKEMYRFISERFDGTHALIQEQALYWLQILTMLEVPVPINLLYTMFSTGVKSLSNPEMATSTLGKISSNPMEPESSKPSKGRSTSGMTLGPSFQTSTGGSSPGISGLSPSATGLGVGGRASPQANQQMNVACYILMLDIIVKQNELQEVGSHKGLMTKDARSVMQLLLDMLKAPWNGTHTCKQFIGLQQQHHHQQEQMMMINQMQSEPLEPAQCVFCEMISIFYQLSMTLVEYFCPPMEATMSDVHMDDEKRPIIKPSHQAEQRAKKSTESESRIPVTAQDISESFGGTTTGTPGEANGKASGDAIPMQDLTAVTTVVANATITGSSTAVEKPIMQASQSEMPQELNETVASDFLASQSVVPAVARKVTVTDIKGATSRATIDSSAKVCDGEDGGEECETQDAANLYQTSHGRFKIDLDELPIELRLVHELIVQLEIQAEADVLYHLLACLKYLALHAEVLNKAAREHRGYLIWCQERYLIPQLWSLCQTEFSHISQLAVSLLLHCVTMPAGPGMFWRIVEDDFQNSEWRARFSAVERVTVIAHFVDSAVVKNSPLLQSTLANAFCFLVHCLDDIHAQVAQRALLNLETIKASSLKLLMWCLETQFDLIIIDRPMILQTVFQLYNHLSDRRFCTWDFFLNRFDTLFLEAQMYMERKGEISLCRDLKNTNINSELFQKKYKRVQEALAQTHVNRSLSETLGSKQIYRRTMVIPPCPVETDYAREVLSKQAVAPVIFKRKSSKFMAAYLGDPKGGGPQGPPGSGPQHFPNSFFQDNQLREQAQEEQHLFHVIHRSGIPQTDQDKDTFHSLTFLLMQFLSRPDQSHPSEEKALQRNQQIVLRHLNILLGWSPLEKVFLIPPRQLRSLPVFNATLTSLAKVLDFNFPMGCILLSSNILPLLIYCPAPEKFAHDSSHMPTYSLWLLKSHQRQSWLTAVVILFYKYQYNTPAMDKQIHALIRIVINTLESRFHRCKMLHDQLISPLPSRSRDMSTASIELLEAPPPTATAVAPPEDAMELGAMVLRNHVDAGDDTPASAPNGLDGNPDDYDYDEEEDIEGELDELTAIQESDSSDGNGNILEECEESLGELPTTADSTVATATIQIQQEPTQSQGNSEKIAIEKRNGHDLRGLDSVQEHSEGAEGAVEETMAGIDFDEPILTIIKTDEVKLDMPPDDDEGDRHRVPSLTQSASHESDHLKYRPKIQRMSALEGSLKLKKSSGGPELAPTMSTDSDVQKYYSEPASESSRTSTKSTGRALSEAEGRDRRSLRTASIEIAPSAHSHKHPKEIKQTFSLDIAPRVGPSEPLVPTQERLLPIGGPSRGGYISPSGTGQPLGPYDENKLIELHKAVQATQLFQIQHHHRAPRQKVSTESPSSGRPFTPGSERLLPIGPTPQPKAPKGITAPDIARPKPTPSSQPGQAVAAKEEPRSAKGSPIKTATKKTPTKSPLKTAPGGKDPIAQIHRHPPQKTESLPAKQEPGASPKKALKVVQSAPLPAKGDTPTSATAPLKPSSSSSVTSSSSTKPSVPPTLKQSSRSDSFQQQEGAASGETKEDIKPPSGQSTDTDEASKSGKPLYNKRKQKKARRKIETQKSSDSRKSGVAATVTRRAKRTESSIAGSGGGSNERERDREIPDRVSQGGGGGAPPVNVVIKPKPKSANGSIAGGSTGKGTGQQTDQLYHESCSNCCQVLEEFQEEELSLCIIILRAYIHREPQMAATVLPHVLQLVAKYAQHHQYPWQSESSVHLPGNAASVARQFLRCTLHQLSSNGIFLQLFQSAFVDMEFFRAMALSLLDFPDLTQIAPMQELFDELNERKHLPNLPEMMHILDNLASYMECISVDQVGPVGSAAAASNHQAMTSLLQAMDTFFRRFHLQLTTYSAAGQHQSNLVNMSPILRIMVVSLKSPAISSFKSILDPYSKILSYCIQHSPLRFESLLEICHLCCRNFQRERDRLLMTRTIICELVNGIKFRVVIPDENLVMLLQLVLLDAGGSMVRSVVTESLFEAMEMNDRAASTSAAVSGSSSAAAAVASTVYMVDHYTHLEHYCTCALECMRNNVFDVIEFVSDIHTISKTKSHFLGTIMHLNEETLGGHLKAGLSQYLALEMSKSNGRDAKAVTRYLPWLYSLPSIQQGPKEYIDCVAHIRLLSWILLGALQHHALMHPSSSYMLCQPIPLEANVHVAEHIQVILAGFAEQSKTSVLHMSSLFHAFNLCQLWTLYGETIANQSSPSSEQSIHCLMVLADFWAKITPGILQLVCHSKAEEHYQLAEMVCLHFVTLMEALMECNSVMLAKLMPMWVPVFNSYRGQLFGHLRVRLDACINWEPPSQTKQDTAQSLAYLLRWTQKMQFKMTQIELQSSAATQFYCI